MLYPQENECRDVRDLSGIWRFKLDPDSRGRKEGWEARPLEGTVSMPVPSSYNDIGQDSAYRDHVGDAWYERDIIFTPSLKSRRVVLRFGGAAHTARAWLNGREAVEHAGAGLPFESEVTSLLDAGPLDAGPLDAGPLDADHPARLTVVVNNVLDWTTLPPGQLRVFDDVNKPATGLVAQEYFHDFFNYAGIDRPVKLYTTPARHISDITVRTDVRGGAGLVAYAVTVSGTGAAVRVSLLDEAGARVAGADGAAGELSVPGARLWQPGKPYLYTLFVETIGEDRRREDCYRLAVGIRTVRVTPDAFRINDAPFYFRGFGKHEDSDIRGKGLDNALNVKDFNIMAWMGANSFRTSHYPYSDEIMDLADRVGMVVIDEMPAVGMHFFKDTEKVFTKDRVGEKSLQRHLQTAQELVDRDKNHPCVVMWSVGNEAATYEEDSGPHFRKVLETTRRLDSTRPITLVHANSADAMGSVVGDLFDVVCVNEYHGWYIETSHLPLIEQRLLKELREIHRKYRKPVIVTEFGAEAIAGLHKYPPLMFTEEFQCEFLEHYFSAFDQLDFIIGEHVWCFADFATKQELSRVTGNRKGVFTRQRDPKAAAHLLRKRWTAPQARATSL